MRGSFFGDCNVRGLVSGLLGGVANRSSLDTVLGLVAGGELYHD